MLVLITRNASGYFFGSVSWSIEPITRLGMPARARIGVVASPFAGIDRADDEMDLVAEGELLREVDRLGRVAGGVAGQQLDLAAEDAAGGVDLLDGQLHALVLGQCGGRQAGRSATTASRS